MSDYIRDIWEMLDDDLDLTPEDIEHKLRSTDLGLSIDEIRAIVTQYHEFMV